jgi:hypothetical protein
MSGEPDSCESEQAMTRIQYVGLVGLVCFGVIAAAAIHSSAQRVAVGGSGTDLLHMGPFLEIKGQQEIPVLNSDNSALFRIFNDGGQAVRILGGPDGALEVTKIEPGKFQFVGGKRFAIVGTEKDKSTTVFLVHLK